MFLTPNRPTLGAALIYLCTAFALMLSVFDYARAAEPTDCQASSPVPPDNALWPPNWQPVKQETFNPQSHSKLQTPAAQSTLLDELAEHFTQNQQEALASVALCGGYYTRPQLYNPAELTNTDPDKIRGWADTYQYDSSGIASLCGDVILRKEELQIESQHVRIDQEAQTADLFGEVKITSRDTLLQGENAKLFLSTNQTELYSAKFFFFPQHARGTAKKITSQGNSATIIDSGQYTTCPPGNNDWSIEGKHIFLNHEGGWGTLTHMRLKLGKVPIFYTPYFRFPLDDKRHTGFLFPSINSISDPDFAVPFYWNIAPNYDLLINARYIGGRGVLSEGQFRYLHQPGEGKLEIGYLPNDKEFAKEDRKQAQWVHSGQIGDHWQWLGDVGYLSDNDYLNDLGAELSTVGQSFVNRTLSLQGSQGAWSTLMELQSYQTIDAAIAPSDQPYRKLPQINLSHVTSFFDYRLEMANQLQYTYWAQPRANSTPYAHRAHWQAELSAPLRDSWYFFSPSASLQSTYYDLMGNNSATIHGHSGKRTVPTFSLDTGLFFDRPVVFKTQPWTQSLEPRLFHTYTPYRDQDWLPVFDATALTFGFDQLFRPNRFSGVDRIGDTHQSTLAVTTRILDTQRQERASLTLGQIIYHKDRAVSLPDASELTNTRSAAVLRGTLSLPDRASLTGGLSWDSQQNNIEDGNLGIIGTQNPNFMWQTQYRYRRNNAAEERLEQINFAFRKHLTGAWHFVNGLHYDMENTQLLEQLTGFQYEDCCWRTDFVYYRRIQPSTDLLDNSENNYSFLIQFELKGLGGIGSRLNSLLSAQIPGYQP